MTSCIFCQIIAGKQPATILYQDEQVTAFRDLHPQGPTHILLVPNRHISSMAEVQAADGELLGALLLAAAQLARQAGLGGYRLVINNGAEAGQSVWHLHLHLIGGRPMRWPPG
jgi:histidine triad (HIT) family protein